MGDRIITTGRTDRDVVLDLISEKESLQAEIKSLRLKVEDDPKKRNRQGPAGAKLMAENKQRLEKFELWLQVVETQLKYMGLDGNDNAEFVVELDRVYELAWRRMEVYTLRLSSSLTKETKDLIEEHEDKIEKLKKYKSE